AEHGDCENCNQTTVDHLGSANGASCKVLSPLSESRIASWLARRLLDKEPASRPFVCAPAIRLVTNESWRSTSAKRVRIRSLHPSGTLSLDTGTFGSRSISGVNASFA